MSCIRRTITCAVTGAALAVVALPVSGFDGITLAQSSFGTSSDKAGNGFSSFGQTGKIPDPKEESSFSSFMSPAKRDRLKAEAEQQELLRLEAARRAAAEAAAKKAAESGNDPSATDTPEKPLNAGPGSDGTDQTGFDTNGLHVDRFNPDGILTEARKKVFEDIGMPEASGSTRVFGPGGQERDPFSLLEAKKQAEDRVTAANLEAAAAALTAEPVEPTAVTETGLPQLSWPVDCQLGGNCWIASFFDHGATIGQPPKDVMCGDLTRPGSQLTNIAVRRTSGATPAVYAAADGLVMAVRNDMPDNRPYPDAPLGNTVLLLHKGGVQTSYSHLAHDSATVEIGDRVRAGDLIGHAGSSGNTTYPQIGFMVSVAGEPLDPFVGPLAEPEARGCGPHTNLLFPKDLVRQGFYIPIVIYQAGLSDRVPEPTRVRQGELAGQVAAPDPPVLHFFADMFGINAGDTYDFTLTFPNGKTTSLEGPIDAPAWHKFLTLKIGNRYGAWPSGIYQGKLEVARHMADGRRQIFQAATTMAVP